MILDLDDLITRVQAFSERWHRHATDFVSFATLNICRFNRSSTNINSSFLFFQLLVDLILRVKPLETDRGDFCAHCIKMCQTKYGNNENEVYLRIVLEKICEFQVEIYSTKMALKWYTKNAFLYDIVNNSFRTNDFETIFRSRFVIREIHQQLMKRQINSTIRVYRGQRMSNAEAELLGNSIGKLVSMKSFLSTSLDRDVAEMFAGIGSDNTSEETAFVLFIIDTIPNESNKALRPFGNIDDISHFEGAEKEILFMVGSIFCIKDVTQDSRKQLWTISMVMCDQEDDELRKILSWPIHEQNTHGTDDSSYYDFANLLLAMDMPNEAQDFCHNLLHEYTLLRPRNNELAKCYYMLGKAALLLGLQQSHNSQSEIPPDSENLYHGEHTKNDQNQIYLHSASSPPILFESSHLNESLQYFEKAFENIDETAADYYVLAGSIHHETANAYRALRDFKTALNSYEKALLYYRESIGMMRRLIVEVYVDLGRMYCESEDLHKALDYHRRALYVAKTILPETHPAMGVFYMSLAIVYAKMNQKGRALNHIRAAMAINPISFPNGKPLLSSNYRALYVVYKHKESINTFQANKDNMHGRQTIQQPNVQQARSLPPACIYYSCPWCDSNVWVYQILDYFKGSPCFKCILHELPTSRSPRMDPDVALCVNYFANGCDPMECKE